MKKVNKAKALNNFEGGVNDDDSFMDDDSDPGYESRQNREGAATPNMSKDMNRSAVKNPRYFIGDEKGGRNIAGKSPAQNGGGKNLMNNANVKPMSTASKKSGIDHNDISLSTKGITKSKIDGPKPFDDSKQKLNNVKQTQGNTMQQEKEDSDGPQRIKPLKETLQERDKNAMPSKGVKRTYTSRRDYKHSYSDDEEGEVKDTNLKTQTQTRLATDGTMVVVQPNEKFSSYRKIFSNLLKHNSIKTKYPVVSMNIAYDSSRVTTVTKCSDCEYWITMYSLVDFQTTFREKIGGDESQYIKLQELVQNDTGSQFACVYSDDGKFRLRAFGRESRTDEEIEEQEVKINEMLDLDSWTMTNDDFCDPFINCCFVGNDKIYIAFFHNYTKTHYHFIWDLENRRIIGDQGGTEPVKHVIECGKKNFPYKSFYYDERDELYTFYRTGQAFTIKQKDLSDYRFEQITDKELGQMVLIYGKALVARSSTRILFFQQIWNEDIESMEWVHYHTINERAFIYFMPGNIRIQLTTEKLVYFYLIDQETLMPDLENVMYNYMGCSQMMFGRKVRNGVTYKTNQTGFDVYQRHSMHNLRVCVNADDFEGSRALEIGSSNIFLVTKVDKIIMFEIGTFKQCGSIPISLLPTETREPNEIIGIEKSPCENWLAVVSGKNLVMNEQKQNQLFIFKKVPATSELGYDQFELHKRVVVKDMPIFKKVTMQYMFKNFNQKEEPTTMIFAKADMIFELNFSVEPALATPIYTMQSMCELQPTFFKADPSQTKFLLASSTDGLWIDMPNKKEVDLDDLHQIRDIKYVLYDEEEKQFYVLCNRKAGIIGFFLFSFSESDPKNFKYLTMWRHQLDIDDANMAISRGSDKRSGDDQAFKELIISYKTCYINTFTVVIKDLSDSPENIGILAKHEAFQLWESRAQGMLLTDSKDFLSFTKSGINVLALGQVPKRKIVDNEGQNKMIHSLDSLSFLKVDATNLMNFKCQEYSNRVVSIEQEHTSGGTQSDERDNYYYDIYKIKIHEVTLRELLILQSLYLCKTQSDISNLVELQPKPQFFYKSFLEFDGGNILSVLSFDSKAVASLLSEDNSSYFSEEFPVIYQNKVMKKSQTGYYLTSPIETALKNNQVAAVNSILKYVKQFQNNYTSSYLFLRSLPKLMENEILLSELLESKIFTVEFDFDSWPGNHYNEEECIRPYNGSYFDIRDRYRDVFPEDEFNNEDLDEHMDKAFKKIKYSVNLLSQVNMFIEEDGNVKTIFNEEINLMQMAAKTEELSLVCTSSFADVIDYKWDTYGRASHFLGLFMHLYYIVVFTLYVIKAYLQNNDKPIFLILLTTGILYPAGYAVLKFIKQGFDVFMDDTWNLADIVYYTLSILNIILHFIMGKDVVICKTLMCLIVIFQIIKTFFFLRIFPTLTPIIVMLKKVVYDLKVFLFFYLILITLFSQLLAVLGLGNSYEKAVETGTRTNSDTGLEEEYVVKTLDTKVDTTIGTEYNAVGLHIGEWMWTLRLSMGDFSAIGPSTSLEGAENWIFWFTWGLIVIVTCVIFLNFIVAEASASYTKVTESLEEFISQEKASLIFEAESMASLNEQNEINYPKYLIKRSIDS